MSANESLEPLMVDREGAENEEPRPGIARGGIAKNLK